MDGRQLTGEPRSVLLGRMLHSLFSSVWTRLGLTWGELTVLAVSPPLIPSQSWMGTKSILCNEVYPCQVVLVPRDIPTNEVVEGGK